MLNKVKSFKALAGAAVFAALTIGVTAAQAGVVVVSATSDIFIAGASSVPPTAPGTDGSVPFQAQTLFSPRPGAGTLPASVAVSAGQGYNFSTSGTVSCGIGCTPNGPGGSTFAANISYNGLSSSANAMTLLGEWGNAGGLLGNLFTIGTSSGPFVAPAGATELYLGFNDAFFGSSHPGTYNDNQGSLDVNITSSGVPEPATWALMLLGFAGLGFAGYSKTAKRVGQSSAA